MSDARSEAMGLGDLHDMPWRTVEGAHVRVEIEEDTRDPLDPRQDDVDEPYEYVEREGTIVGRGAGTGLYYDTDRGELMETSLGPKIVLNTPEDTILEVVTDKLGNELLAFDVGGGGDGDE